MTEYSWLPVLALCSMVLGASWAGSEAESPGERPSALAGGWYPGDAEELARYVDDLLDANPDVTPSESVRALVVPHAGYRYSGATAARAFSRVRGQAFKRVLVLAPAHRIGFSGLSIADVGAYRTPLGAVPLDTDAAALLREAPLVSADPDAHQREHSIEIELPMLQRALATGWELLPVLVGRLDGDDYRVVAGLLRPFLDDQTLLVVSSDFTHYGPRFDYMPFPLDDATPERIRALDEGALARIEGLDPDGFLAYQRETGITVCGYRPLALMLRLLPVDARIERIAYMTSGALTGDYGNSVSYAALLVTAPKAISEAVEATGLPQSLSDERGDISEQELATLHRLAVLGVEQAVLGPSEARRAEVERLTADLPPRLQEPSGAFVTLKKHGELRGCIGYIQPRSPLFQAVLENGVNAAVNDRRFRPVTPRELEQLEVEVSVLTKPRPIETAEEFQVGEHGIILSKNGRRAVFLPAVAAEQGWDREQTLSHLARKAHLPENAWRNGASFEVFSSVMTSGPVAAQVSRKQNDLAPRRKDAKAIAR